MAETASGILALLGGEEFDEPCRDLDAWLLEASGTTDVCVVPTAAAFENPRKVVGQAEEHFSGLGAKASAVWVLHHADADDAEAVATVKDARFVYLTGGSPMHLRAVLHGSKLWDALLDAYRGGATLAASGSGAVVLCDPMVDPRGGAYTVGLGLLANVAVLPHHDTVRVHLRERAAELRPQSTVLAGVDEHTALVRRDGGWEARGPGAVTIYSGDGEQSFSNAAVAGLPT
jgi:cyanophycinase